MTFAPLKESGAKPAFGRHAPAGLVEYALYPLMWIQNYAFQTA